MAILKRKHLLDFTCDCLRGMASFPIDLFHSAIWLLPNKSWQAGYPVPRYGNGAFIECLQAGAFAA